MKQTTDWQKIRTRYRLPQQRTYFNTSSFGAMSDQTIAIQKDCLDQWQNIGNHLNERTYEATENVRRMILEMINGQEHQVGVIPDVSTAMNQLAEVLQSKKKVALLKTDYPATSAPWLVRDFDITWIERTGLGFELEDIERALKSGVEVLVLSWVMYNSGVKLDIKAIGDLCKQYGVIFIVDATQGMMACPLNLDDIHVDVVLASAFKWMMAGYGIAVAIASDAFLKQYEITIAGQNTLISGEAEATDLQNYRKGIERLEVGHAKIQQVLALENSLNEIVEIGLEAIQMRTLALGTKLAESLTAIDVEVLTPEPASHNILMIEGRGDRVERLQKSNIDFTHRHGLIRLGTYFYNNEEDIDRLIKALN